MFWKKGNRGQKGFTLVELLVVIGILAVLAGVSIPAYNKFFASGRTEANATEVVSVQAAMDSMMANKAIIVVAAQAIGTNAFSALPTGTGTDPLYPAYLRKSPTRCNYTWTVGGVITQSSCP